ncbi:MAG: glycoside hydrolase family 13 protein [Oscillospiraceae bacterium]|jgi:4-alpha-glucanotransferase|nr:glycoside hydrolase family 13 protein [Oscillospiraceae bacterium]
MRPVHNSRDAFYRDPPGAVPAGTIVRLRLAVEGEPRPDSVAVRVWTDRETWTDMTEISYSNNGYLNGNFNGYLYETPLTAPKNPGLVWYDFRVRVGGIETAYGNAPDKLGGEGAVWAELPPSFQMTVYDPDFAPPSWMRRAVVYQIFPDRFNGGPLRPDGSIPASGSTKNIPGDRLLHSSWYDPPGMGVDPDGKDYRAQDFYGGTLEGIRRSLPRLADMGITCLYLNPVFESPSNHRYNTTDYHKIDPMLGTERDFTALCESAREHGIRVMLDGVFSHVGADSPYFRDAALDKGSPYAGWFAFRHWPDDYECWWGVPSLPNVNEMEPSYLDFMLRSPDAVVTRWIRAGARGWRLDVADELPMPFLRELRGTVKRVDPDACVLGEVWENASCKIAYGELRSYVLGDTLDSVMNYPLRAALISFLIGAVDAPRAARVIEAMMEQYPKPFAYALMNLTGSHDRARILNELACATGESMPRADRAYLRLTDSQRGLARERLMLMFGFIAAWPGMPSIYYGDESGMEGAGDPYCRAAYPWGREDEATRAFFIDAIKRRGQSPALISGEARLAAPDCDVLAIVREIRGGFDALGEPAMDALAFYAMNRSGEPKTLKAFLPDGPREFDLPPRGSVLWQSDDYTVSTPFSASIIFSICSSAPVSASM